IQGSGVNVSASTTGCSIVFSDTISLDDVESNYNDFGFDMFYSDAVIISNSTVIGADEGVHFYACNYCEVQNCTILDCTDYGIHDIAGYYLIVNDNEIHNNAEGIWVTTTGGIFSNNTVSGHYGSGHAIYCQGWDCIIDNNTCSDYWAGIRIVINTNNTIRNNHVYNTGHGIHLYYSSNITVQHNYVENGDQCIDLYYSHNVTVEDNTCNDHVPFYLLGSDNNTFRSNTIMNYVNYGIRIDNSSSNIVEDSIFTSSANYGVLLYYCSETTLSNLTIENVINKGIYLHYSSMSIINKCIIRNCEYAIHSYYCLSTTCNASTLEDCSLYGMFNERSSGTTMTFNNISRCEYGLEIYISDDCIAAINTVVDCQTGIMITGTHNTLTANVLSRSGVFLESQYMTVSGNWVDGKPIGYFANLTSGTYDCSGFGQVFFVNCDNLDIHSGIFENVSFGLVLADCDYSTVHDIYVNYPYRIGIYLIRGYSCTLENFTCINSSGSGVWTYQTDQCTVRNGTTFNNAVWGVYIRESPNTIVANITSNGDGIDIYASNYSVVEDCVIANSNLMGLLIQGSDYCEIQFNTIWNSGEAALAIYSSSHTYAAYNNLSDSYWPANVRIQDSYNTTIYWNHILHDEYYDGILITNSDYNYIINNTILDNGCYGIRVESTSTNCHIYSNIIAYNGVENAWDDGASNSWDNGIHGNKWNDYSGIGTYAIPGSALSVDHYPQLYDTFAPTIDSPSDVTYDAGESGASITWAPRDGHPSTFQIYRNGTSIASGPWGGGDIPIDVDGLGIGTYNYTLKVTDLAGNVKIDTVYVFVRFDSKPPTLDQPADFQYSEFVAGNVSWMPLDVHPSSYDIYQDSILITSSPWDGGDISYAFNLTMGAYNFTIVVFDTVGNNVADTVFVTILDDSPPVIIGPDDFLVFLGTIDEVLRWNVTDAHPNTAIVYKNGTQVVTANFYGTFANVSINTLIEGVFNYTVIVWDTSGNNARNTVWITIWNPDFPFIDHPDDIEFVEGTAGNYLEWNPISNQPDTYSIEVNGTEKKSGIWSVNITINLDDFAVGIHNITAIVWSQTGNSATDTVFLRVLYNPPPEIDSPADLMYVESIGLGQITWHPTDDNPNWWYLYINGTLRSDGGWTGGKVVGNVSYLSHGIYNATLVVEDIGGKTISDTVYVRVVYELNPPVIAGPADLSYTFGDTGNVLSWGAFDEHPSHLLVYSNGTIVDTRAWDGSVITTSVDGLEPGVHNITLLLYDIDLNSNSDTVMVFVENIQPPTLSLQPDVTTQQGADSQLNWNPSSLFPDHYEIYVNGSMDVSTTWNGGSISYDLKYLEPGVYNITLVVYDQAGNSASDSVWVHIEGMGALPDFMSPLIQAGSVVTILVVIAAAYRIFKQAGQSKEESDWRSMMDDFGH
ncbi:MAG: right-handed parallel beta-helix repeat-containing protein, partial [Candidatus Thorarchaeota archaeon]|nr:right-handed parallel beta-helix repeat-containing protein [Candidatus Thorarchaeota archaeon]